MNWMNLKSQEQENKLEDSRKEPLDLLKMKWEKKKKKKKKKMKQAQTCFIFEFSFLMIEFNLSGESLIRRASGSR